MRRGFCRWTSPWQIVCWGHGHPLLEECRCSSSPERTWGPPQPVQVEEGQALPEPTSKTCWPEGPKQIFACESRQVPRDPSDSGRLPDQTDLNPPHGGAVFGLFYGSNSTLEAGVTPRSRDHHMTRTESVQLLRSAKAEEHESQNGAEREPEGGLAGIEDPSFHQGHVADGCDHLQPQRNARPNGLMKTPGETTVPTGTKVSFQFSPRELHI